MAAATAALIVGALAAATATGYQISETESQKRRAGRKAEEIGRNAASAEADLRARMANQESSEAAQATQQAARRRQRRAAQGAGGAAGTILTGPTGLGAPGAGEQGQKTLLGA
jgi:hypothetical protein